MSKDLNSKANQNEAECLRVSHLLKPTKAHHMMNKDLNSRANQNEAECLCVSH